MKERDDDFEQRRHRVIIYPKTQKLPPFSYLAKGDFCPSVKHAKFSRVFHLRNLGRH